MRWRCAESNNERSASMRAAAARISPNSGRNAASPFNWVRASANWAWAMPKAAAERSIAAMSSAIRAVGVSASIRCDIRARSESRDIIGRV